MTPPRVVLVRPRSPGNVGSAARALKNFGLRELVLVDPRLHRGGDRPGVESYFESESRRMAWHASDVLDASRTVADLKQAVAGCSAVFATAPQPAARMRSLSPEEAADALVAAPDAAPGALVFGSESSGLTRDELASCAGVVVIPTDPAYRDLNLAQSVAVMAFLCFRGGREAAGPDARRAASDPARHDFVEGTADALFEVAARAGFLKHGGAPVARELRHLLHRAGLSRREAELFRSLWTRLLARLPEQEGGT